jgi:nucleotide-binding universal stress UspA family protein
MSVRIRQILVPTDLSEFGVTALQFGELFHDRLGASAMVMYAHEPPLNPMMAFDESLSPPPDDATIHESLERNLREHMAMTLRDPDAFDVRIVDGPPAQAIRDSARDTLADLIIMGTHGRTGWKRTILGSVAEHVMRETDRPLLTVNAHSASSKRVAIESILCPVNFTALAHDAVRYAAFLAMKFDARLTILNVDEDELPAGDVKRDFEAWVDPSIRDRCDFRLSPVNGGVAASVLETADHLRSDLLVLGAQHRRLSDTTVIGTTTERITRYAWQPVLTIIRKPVERKAAVAA